MKFTPIFPLIPTKTIQMMITKEYFTTALCKNDIKYWCQTINTKIYHQCCIHWYWISNYECRPHYTYTTTIIMRVSNYRNSHFLWIPYGWAGTPKPTSNGLQVGMQIQTTNPSATPGSGRRLLSANNASCAQLLWLNSASPVPATGINWRGGYRPGLWGGEHSGPDSKTRRDANCSPFVVLAIASSRRCLCLTLYCDVATFPGRPPLFISLTTAESPRPTLS